MNKRPITLCWAILLLSAWHNKILPVGFGELWSSPTIRSAKWQNAWSPQIVVDSFGNGLALWYRYDNEFSRIQFARYSALNGVWTPINQVQTLSSADLVASEPQLAINATGNAIAIWTVADSNFFNKRIQTTRYDATTIQWTPIPNLEILSEDGVECNAPQIAVDAIGNAIAVWQLLDDSGTWTVQAVRYDATINDWVRDLSGKPLIKNLSTGIAEVPFFPLPKIAIDKNGNAIIVWQKKDAATYRVEATRYDRSRWITWDPVALREYLSDSTIDAYWPNMAMDRTGNTTVIWQLFEEYLPTFFRETVQAAYYSSSLQDWIRNGPLPSVKNIETYDTATYTEATTTDVAMDHDGNAIIVWQTPSFFIHTTGYVRSILWNNWIPVVKSISPSTRQTLAPRIAMDSVGNGIAAWLFVDDNVNLRLQVSYYNQRTNLWLDSNDTPLLSPEGNDAIFQQIVMDSNGDAIVVWQQSDGIHYRIRESHFEAVLRPRYLQASQIVHRYPCRTDLINIIRWDMTDPTIIRYDLYTNEELTQLVGSVLASCKSILYHHCRKPCVQDAYYLVAVDQCGDHSKPTHVTIP